MPNASKTKAPQTKPKTSAQNPTSKGKSSPKLSSSPGGAGGAAPSRRNGGMGGTELPGGHLSNCVSTFFDVLADPFDEPASACLPSEPCFPSQKYKTWAKGFLTTSSANNGWICLDPGALAVSDVDSVWVTTGAVGTTQSFSPAVGTGIVALRGNSPYTAADVTGDTEDGIGIRLVALGLRVRSRANAMIRDGDTLMFAEPQHGTLAGMSASNLLAFEDVHPEKNGDTWRSIRLCPNRPDEFNYGTGGSWAVCIGAMFLATAGQTIDFEVCAHYEAIGRGVQGLLEDSMLDPVGGPVALSMVINQHPMMVHPGVEAAHMKAALLSRVAQDVTAPHPYTSRHVTQARQALLKSQSQHRSISQANKDGFKAAASHVAKIAATHAFKHAGNLLSGAFESGGSAEIANTFAEAGFGEDLLAFVVGLL